MPEREKTYLKISSIATFSTVCVMRPRNVDVEAASVSLTYQMRRVVLARIQMQHMKADVEKVRVSVECLLDAVAVMHIPIDYENALGTEALSSVKRRQNDIIEETKAHCGRRLGVMARRTNHGKGVTHMSFHDAVDYVEEERGRRSSCRMSRRAKVHRVEAPLVVLEIARRHCRR